MLALLGLSKFTPYRKPVPASPSPTKAPLNEPTPMMIKNYSIAMQPIDANQLTLISNFSEKKTSSEIMEQNTCAYGVNGGYYTTENKPLGLFITDGIQLGRPAVSSAANAFLSKNKDGKLAISQTPPSAQAVTFALQAGPYLIPGVTPQIMNDEHARRVLIAQTNEKTWFFLIIFDKENTYNGPLLSEVPEILNNMRIPMREALNLDGGTASAFYNIGGFKFGELTMVGSFFCGK